MTREQTYNYIFDLIEKREQYLKDYPEEILQNFEEMTPDVFRDWVSEKQYKVVQGQCRRGGLNPYLVVAKCGHVGRGKYLPVVFGVLAKDKKEAAEIIIDMPRVKHDSKTALLSDVYQASVEEYCRVRQSNSRDPFLLAHNSQEGRIIDQYVDPLLLEEERFSMLKQESEGVYNKSSINSKSYKKSEKFKAKNTKHKNFGSKKSFGRDYDRDMDGFEY